MERNNIDWRSFPEQGSWVAIVDSAIWVAPAFLDGTIDRENGGYACECGDDELDDALVAFANSIAADIGLAIRFTRTAIDGRP